MRSVMGESGTALGKDKVNDKMLICVKCLTNLRCEKNGVLVARDPHHVQRADLYKCPECGFEIITGAGDALNWEQALRIYKGEISGTLDLYRMDVKTIRKDETVEV